MSWSTAERHSLGSSRIGDPSPAIRASVAQQLSGARSRSGSGRVDRSQRRHPPRAPSRRRTIQRGPPRPPQRTVPLRQHTRSKASKGWPPSWPPPLVLARAYHQATAPRPGLIRPHRVLSDQWDQSPDGKADCRQPQDGRQESDNSGAPRWGHPPAGCRELPGSFWVPIAIQGLGRVLSPRPSEQCPMVLSLGGKAAGNARSLPLTSLQI